MPVTAIPSTTLTAAIDNNTTGPFQVGSTANMVVGMSVVIGGEMMKLQAIPSSGFISVTRGIAGTAPWAHAANDLVYFATPDTWSWTINQAYSSLGLTGASGQLPQFLMPGIQGVDGRGNVFLLVDAGAAFFAGTTVIVSIDGTFTANIATGSTHGTVGLIVEETASTQWTWAQIYGKGLVNAQDGFATTDVTSASVAIILTSLSTPNVGVGFVSPSSTDQQIVWGMWPTGVGTSAVTSATSSTGHQVPVWLNYPYATGWATNAIAPST